MANKDILTSTQRFRISNNPESISVTDLKQTGPQQPAKYFDTGLSDKQKKQVVLKLIRFLKGS